MSICPAGHRSDSDDYCDTCGAPIEQPSVPAPSSAPGTPPPVRPTAAPAPAVVDCPNCSTENVVDALFCEACGYDFTTGTMPRPMFNPFATLPGDPGDAPPPEQPDQPEQPDRPSADADTGPSVDLPPAAPSSAAPAPEPQPAPELQQTSEVSPAQESSPAGEPVPTETLTGADDTSAPAERADDAPPAAPDGHLTGDASVTDPTDHAPEEEPYVPGGFDEQTFEPTPSAGPTPSTEDAPYGWVAEMWVDPDWYRKQEPPDPMPSPGLPDVIRLRGRTASVGRASRSRNITPDIDCDADPGASRRQAQLSFDGRRWFVEDLDSANGTYVAGATEGLPDTPLRPHTRHELDPDDRIYLGAWTRLVIRRATSEEQEAYG